LQAYWSWKYGERSASYFTESEVLTAVVMKSSVFTTRRYIPDDRTLQNSSAALTPGKGIRIDQWFSEFIFGATSETQKIFRAPYTVGGGEIFGIVVSENVDIILISS
jgi:hypothetical protein